MSTCQRCPGTKSVNHVLAPDPARFSLKAARINEPRAPVRETRIREPLTRAPIRETRIRERLTRALIPRTHVRERETRTPAPLKAGRVAPTDTPHCTGLERLALIRDEYLRLGAKDASFSSVGTVVSLTDGMVPPPMALNSGVE